MGGPYLVPRHPKKKLASDNGVLLADAVRVIWERSARAERVRGCRITLPPQMLDHVISGQWFG